MFVLALVVALISPKLDSACADGDAVACNRIGWSYWKGLNGYEVDPAKAVPHFERACEGGHVMACNNLGWALFRGFGTVRDYERARAAWEAGCTVGQKTEPKACVNLAYMWQRGLGGLAREPDTALSLYRLGCVGGAARGCWRVATLSPDPAERSAMLQKACDGGVEPACAKLD